MKHKILTSTDMHPYEVIQVELIGESDSDLNSIVNGGDVLENYLTFKLNAVDVIDSSPPVFTIKCVKKNLGIGS
jgi:hypothetical protein